MVRGPSECQRFSLFIFVVLSLEHVIVIGHTRNGDAHNTSDDTKPSHDGKNIGQWVNYGIFFFQQFFLQAICHLSSQPLTTLFIVLFLMKRSIFNKLPELMESVFLKRFLSFHKSHFKTNLKRLYIEMK